MTPLRIIVKGRPGGHPWNGDPWIGFRERGKRDKRERILAAARELFTRHGFSGVATQQIADRADVAIGTLYLYPSTRLRCCSSCRTRSSPPPSARLRQAAHPVLDAFWHVDGSGFDFRCHGATNLPFDVVERFVNEARRRLPSS